MYGEFFFVIFLASVIVLTFLAGNASAEEDSIMICGPCSRNYIPEINAVIQELGLLEKVDIKITECLGHCEDPAVFSFRGITYSGMDRSSTTKVLRSAFEL